MVILNPRLRSAGSSHNAGGTVTAPRPGCRSPNPSRRAPLHRSLVHRGRARAKRSRSLTPMAVSRSGVMADGSATSATAVSVSVTASTGSPTGTPARRTRTRATLRCPLGARMAAHPGPCRIPRGCAHAAPCQNHSISRQPSAQLYRYQPGLVTTRTDRMATGSHATGTAATLSLGVRAVRDAVTFGPSEPGLEDPPLPHRVGLDLTGVPAPGHRRPWIGSPPRW